MAIFSKFFGDAMSHILGQNAGKKINTISELFIKQKIEFKFVLFSSPQSLLKLGLAYTKNTHARKLLLLS